MKFLVLSALLVLADSLNTKLLNVDKPAFSDKMKEFMRFIVAKHSSEKIGFLYVAINQIQSEYSDYALKLMNLEGTVLVVDLDKQRSPNLNVNPNHFKFVLCDPEGELEHAQNSFAKVRQSRAKIVQIFIQTPTEAFLNIVLQAFWAIQVINVILVYENNNEIIVLSHNPYKPRKYMTLNFTDSKYTRDLFEDKTKDLMGNKVKALLTYRDRTKIKEIADGKYVGKDYEAISTIVGKINGRLEIEEMDYWTNPWHESVDYENRTELKINILKERQISILIKSESFNVDDNVVDNLYPHTQNDLCCLINKSIELSVPEKILSIYPPREWFVVVILPWVISLVLLTVRRAIAKSLTIETTSQNMWNLIAFSIPKHPIDRLLILAWTINCFVVSTYLQSKITSLFALKQFRPELDTVDEVFATGIPLYSLPKDAEEIWRKYEGTRYDKFRNTSIPLSAHEGIIDEILARDYSSQKEASAIFFLIEHDFAVYISRRFRQSNGVPVYHLVRESIIPKLQSYKIAHESPLYEIFNKNLRRLGEGGFIELWSKQAIFNATIQQFIYPEEQVDFKRKPEPLKLCTFHFPFYVLLVGLMVSFVTFLLEFCVHKI